MKTIDDYLKRELDSAGVFWSLFISTNDEIIRDTLNQVLGKDYKNLYESGYNNAWDIRNHIEGIDTLSMYNIREYCEKELGIDYETERGDFGHHLSLKEVQAMRDKIIGIYEKNIKEKLSKDSEPKFRFITKEDEEEGQRKFDEWFSKSPGCTFDPAKLDEYEKWLNDGNREKMPKTKITEMDKKDFYNKFIKNVEIYLNKVIDYLVENSAFEKS